jgi:hypothetical protein
MKRRIIVSILFLLGHMLESIGSSRCFPFQGPRLMYRSLCFSVVYLSIAGACRECVFAQEVDPISTRVASILEAEWVDEPCREMGRELVGTWGNIKGRIPGYVVEELEAFLEMRLQQLQTDLVGEQYLTDERRQTVVALQFYSNSLGLLQLVDRSWPTEAEWNGIDESYEGALTELQQELQKKRRTGTIPREALDATDARIKGMVTNYRTNLFHPRAFLTPTDEDIRNIVEIFRDSLNAIERYFVRRGSSAYDANARAYLSQHLADLDTKLGTYFNNALDRAVVADSPTADKFRERHKEAVERIGVRLTESTQAEWAARKAWVDKRSRQFFEEGERNRAEAH